MGHSSSHRLALSCLPGPMRSRTGRLITADVFQRLTAPDQIRLLLVSMDILTELNQEVPRLAKIAKIREVAGHPASANWHP
jgi:hypothetical protein